MPDALTFLNTTLLTILGSLQLASGTFLILVGAALMALIMTILTSIDERLERKPELSKEQIVERMDEIRKVMLDETRVTRTPPTYHSRDAITGESLAFGPLPTSEHKFQIPLPRVHAEAAAAAYAGPTPTANTPAAKQSVKRKPRKKAKPKKGSRKVKRSYEAGTRG
jgi:hypothetical protein